MDESHHRLIIQSFGDLPERISPFSIHALVSLGALWGKRAGDWYGPSSVAHLLSQAVEHAAKNHPVFNNLAVYVAQDCAGNKIVIAGINNIQGLYLIILFAYSLSARCRKCVSNA